MGFFQIWCNMGAMCGKPLAVEDSRDSPRQRRPSKVSSDLHVHRLNSSRREDRVRVKDRFVSGDIKAVLVDKKTNGSKRIYDDQVEKKKREKHEVAVVNFPVPKAVEREQVAAGWPSWLAAVAGEALKGWVPRRADTFVKLDKIGQGTYSNVYKARDLTNGKMVALKRVRFDNMDLESIKFMAREIILLRRLDHPNIIKLEGLVTSGMSCSLYLVFEYMEHDLTGLAALPGIKFTEPQVKCYMQQLLSGLDHCHSRGVLHRDIKGSNLLIDNHGILKIADFGLASAFDPRHSTPLTSRVVTLWYRPPELLLGANQYGVAVDLWSTGCILGELYAGKPIMPGRTEVEQLHKIFKLCGSPSEDFWRNLKLPTSAVFKPQQSYRRCVAETFKDYPAAAVGLLETLLSIDPAHRGTAAGALKSEFFTTNPLACDPSSMPKYPPSKEIDAKLRDEEARRQRAAGGRGHQVVSERKGLQEPRAMPAPNANAELVMSMQKRQGGSNTKCRSEMFNPQDEAVSGFLVGPSRHSQQGVSKDSMEEHHNRGSHSGPLVHGPEWAKNGKKHHDQSGPLVHGAEWAKTRKKHGDYHPAVSTRADLSTLSGLVATRTSLNSQLDEINQVGRVSSSLDEWDSSRKQDYKYHTPRTASIRQVENGKSCTKEPNMHGQRSTGKKMTFSGPLLVPSNNVEEVLKEHDRRIQEIARRARLGKVQSRSKHATAYTTSLISGSGAG